MAACLRGRAAQPQRRPYTSSHWQRRWCSRTLPITGAVAFERRVQYEVVLGVRVNFPRVSGLGPRRLFGLGDLRRPPKRLSRLAPLAASSVRTCPPQAKLAQFKACDSACWHALPGAAVRAKADSACQCQRTGASRTGPRINVRRPRCGRWGPSAKTAPGRRSSPRRAERNPQPTMVAA